MAKDLIMEFMTEGGKKTNITVKNVKADLNEESIKKAMDSIVAKDLFLTKTGAITKKTGAKIVDTKTEEFKFVQ